MTSQDQGGKVELHLKYIMKNIENLEALEEAREEVECFCCSKHVPLPLVHYKIVVNNSIVYLCPTSYYNMNKLLTAYRAWDKIPPGSVRKHYSKYIQDLVLELWKEYNA